MCIRDSQVSADSVRFDRPALSRPKQDARARSDSGKGKNVKLNYKTTYGNYQMHVTTITGFKVGSTAELYLTITSAVVFFVRASALKQRALGLNIPP